MKKFIKPVVLIALLIFGVNTSWGQFSANVIDATCNGAADGSVSLTYTGSGSSAGNSVQPITSCYSEGQLTPVVTPSSATHVFDPEVNTSTSTVVVGPGEVF